MIDFRELLNWDDEQLQDLRLAGFSYLRQGHYDRAATYFEALVAVDPHQIYDLQTLAGLCLQRGDAQRCLELCNQGLELDPPNVACRVNKTKALFTLGNQREGLEMAKELSHSRTKEIRQLGEALVMAYS